MRVALLHAYSADNIGDGMLVDEAFEIVRSAFPGTHIEWTVCASHPETFAALDARVVNSQISKRGYDRVYLSVLKDLEAFDLVIGVGGGYLRGGTCVELAKAALVHGPQLRAAARRSSGVVYLPQSIGPLRLRSLRPVRRLLSRIETIWARDDKTLAELGLFNVQRAPDMAVSHVQERNVHAVDTTPILSVRNARGSVPHDVRTLASLLGPFDGYVQSETGGNRDLEPMKSLGPLRIIPRQELLHLGGPRRVVIAMRLHAALMAIQAGHYVIHLAYERKGHAAFADLGIPQFVHNTFSFEAARVIVDIASLVTDPEARANYDQAINASRPSITSRTDSVVDSLRRGVRRTELV